MMVSSIHTPDMSLRDLLSGFVDGKELPALNISGITGNSKEVNSGDLFFAQSGLTRHAIDFAPDAIKAGAVAVLYDAADEYCKQRVPLLKKQFQVYWIPLPDLTKNTGEIASRYFGHPSHRLKLVGITGTDGKTSVTHLLVQALTNMGLKAGSIGTLGYGVSNRLTMTSYTTPDAITLQSLLSELLSTGCEYVVMEVSSHALEQFRVNGCQFDIAVLTNLGSDHLDYHVTLEQYAQAKSMLFEFPGLCAQVLNVEDSLGRQLLEYNVTPEAVTYSSNVKQNRLATVTVLRSLMTDQGLKVEAKTDVGILRFQTRLIGSFNIDNCLACISVLQLLRFEPRAIERSMQHLKPIPGRMEYFPATANMASAVIDFAHTEQALEACLGALNGYAKGDLYCIFGCGGDRDQSKRPLMAAVAERLADHVILTDDNPRNEPAEDIMRDILVGFKNPQKVRVIHDRKTAIETVMCQAGPEDLVVIAGKGHEEIQIVGNQRLIFSDHHVLRTLREGAA